jgi:hypothetical protein
MVMDMVMRTTRDEEYALVIGKDRDVQGVHTISSHCGGSKRNHVRETVMRRW